MKIKETVGAVVIFSGRPGPELQSPLWRAVWGGGGDGGSGLTIGFYGPFSGPASNIGEQKQIAAEMSRDMINEDGGVHGQDIELVFGDSESQPSAGRNEVNRLIQQENVDAIGGDSTVTSRSQQSRSPPNRELHRSLMRQSRARS